MANYGVSDSAEELSFARKYRPVDFDGYIGNEKLKRVIFDRLKGGSRPQSIILTGHSGCGKTTMARIIIREYMCENRDDETGACGECDRCKELDNYIRTGDTNSTYDISELDIAQNGGKEEINKLLDDMTVTPMMGDWKVYLFDEFHMASSAAQNALLKSFEEPPPGVLIILATTEKQKVLETIYNRINVKLNVQKPNTSELVALLATICKIEGIPYDNEGLRVISNRAGLVIREALNYLEQMVKARGSAETSVVVDELEEVEDRQIVEFLQSYLNRDYVTYTSVLYKIKERVSLSIFLRSLTDFVSRGIYILNGIAVDGLTVEEIGKYADLFKQFSPSQLAHLLAELKRMDYGDIELNFIAFIYSPESVVVSSAAADDPLLKTESVPESKVRSENMKETRAISQKDAIERLVGGSSVLPQDSILSRLEAKRVGSDEKVPRNGA